MPASERELRLLTSVLIGFVAFSLPLLVHDTRQYLGYASTAASGSEDYHTDEWHGPPGPPPYDYHQQYPGEDEPVSKFRRAVADGDRVGAENILQESLALSEPVDLVTAPHWHGSTPLFEAARSGQAEMARWLLERGAQADHTNEWGDSPANEAASMGHWDIVWLLADHGANLTRPSDAHNNHNNLVNSAVRHRSVEALAELQRRSVDLHQKTWNGNTALHEAARQGDGDMVKWLLEHGGLDVNAVNDQGEGALTEAALMGHTDVIWTLLRLGAALGDKDSSQVSSLRHAAIQHANLELLKTLHEKSLLSNDADAHGRIPLIEAVRSADQTVVDFFLVHGANVSATNSQGESPISVAAYEDKFHLVFRMHEAGASLHSLNEHGGSLLMSAVHFGHAEHTRTLLEAGLDVNHANMRGDTPLTLAAARGDVPLVQMLLKHGASAAGRGRRADTPLIRAARFRRVDAARALLDARVVQVNDANRKGDTALNEACRAGSVGVAELLLQHGADVQHKNRMGMLPFLEAAEAGSLELLKLLLAHGADAHAQSKHSEGALELSRWTRHSDEIAAFLKEHGVKPTRPDDDHHDHHDHHEPPEHAEDD